MNNIMKYKKSLETALFGFKFDLKMKIIAILLIVTVFKTNASIHLNNNRNILDVNIETQQGQIEITGKVTDEKGMPLSGATVMIKGSNIAVTTDFDGVFKILSPNGATTLVISYTGYVKKEVLIDGRSTINIKMASDTNALNEVVVVGYGTQKKRDLTGSVTSIKSSELLSAPSSSTAEALQGRAAGVIVQNSSGSPSSTPTIRIRGANSLTFGNDPLVIIDGVQGGSLSSLNPNDIESTEVLKDAASLSIYGSKGANGVILVTTKTGKKGGTRISYNTYTGADHIIRQLPALNATDYSNLVNEYRIDKGQAALFSPSEIAAMEQGTNWQDAIFRDGFTTNHNLSFSGSNDNVNYFVSGSMLNKQGIVINTDFKQYTLRSNFKVQISKKFALGLNSFYSNDRARNGDSEGAINSALQWSPTKNIYEKDGSYSQPGGGVGPVSLYNPVGYANEIVNEKFSKSFIVSPTVEYKFNNYLKATSQISYKYNSDMTGYFNNQVVNAGPASNVMGSRTEANYNSFQNTNILAYHQTFGDHTLDFTSVYEITKAENRILSSSSLGIPVGLGYNGISFGSTILKPYNLLSNSASESIMGRANYSYKSKYLVSLSDRYDGASQLAEGNKYQNFYAISLGWNIMEESFMQNMRGFVKDLKFRASYGTVGNSAVPAYSSQLLFNASVDSNNNPILTLSQIGNPNLKWETTSEKNIGIDASLFAGRVNFSAEYYSKQTDDLLMWQTVPVALGVNSILTNSGTVTNKGFDFSLGGTPVTTDNFKWNSNFVLNYNENRILALDGISDTIIYSSNADYPGLAGSFVQMVGQPMGTFMGFKYTGVWNESEASTAALYGKKPGDAKYVDINKDGKIDNSDVTIIGNAQPKVTFGWNNTFTYKNLDLNVFFQGVSGNKIYNENRIRRESFTSDAFPTNPLVTEHWTPTNQDTDVPAFQGSENINSSRWVEDGSYIRMKNISLTYNFSKLLIERSKFLSAAKIYVSGSNLLTFTKYTGFDPEASMGRDAVAAGVDRGVYPSSKSVILGLGITF